MLAGVLLLGVGCDDAGEQLVEDRRGECAQILNAPMNPAEVVATVNGSKISASALRRELQAKPELTRAQALDGLIVAELLYTKALEEGYGDCGAPEVRQLHRRLMVQTLLAEKIEAPNPSEDIPIAQVREYYESYEGLYYRPAFTTGYHILVSPSETKWNLRKDTIPEEIYVRADKVARKIRARIGDRKQPEFDAKDVNALVDEFKEGLDEEVSIKAEFKIRAPRRRVGLKGAPGFVNSMVKAFTDGIFATEVGEISQPVRTKFGSHIIFVNGKMPEERLKTEEEAFKEIRAKLLKARRGEAARLMVKEINKTPEIKMSYEPLAKVQPAEESGEGGGEATP